MPVPTEVPLQILRYAEFKDHFTAYDDGQKESILDFWNLRQVSTQFKACVEEVFADRYVRNLAIRLYIDGWEVREPCINAMEGWWQRAADVTFEFDRWADASDRVIFKFQGIWRDSGTPESPRDLKPGEREVLEYALKDRNEWDRYPGLDIGEFCLGVFYLDGDFLVQGVDVFPDLEWRLDRRECSFDWKDLFRKHFRYRKAMNLWKSNWVRRYYFC